MPEVVRGQMKVRARPPALPGFSRAVCLLTGGSSFGGRKGLGNRVFVLDVQPQCPLGVRAHDCNIHAVVSDAVTTTRDVAQLLGQPATDGVIVIVWKRG